MTSALLDGHTEGVWTNHSHPASLASSLPATSASPLPGSSAFVWRTVGVLGGGQLGRMFAEEARRLGTRVVVLDPQPNSPAGQVADRQLVGRFDDPAMVAQLASEVDVLTVEIEHVNTAALAAVERDTAVPVRPSSDTIALIQDKYRQKVHLREAGVPVGPFLPVSSVADCAAAGREFGYPFMLKSRKDAYDGRGNAVVNSESDVSLALSALRQADHNALTLYAEKWVAFEQELAVMVARGADGQCAAYPCVSTTQLDSICHTVHAPALVPAEVASAAQALALSAVASLSGAGVYGVEMFLVGKDGLLLNEIAPRPHNSGHYTIEACHTSQFAQHLRCVLGLPLGSCEMVVSAATMINVLGTGDSAADVELSWLPCKAALLVDGAHVHWYGKDGVRKGRKLAHITFVGKDQWEVQRRVAEWERTLADMKKDATTPHTTTQSIPPPSSSVPSTALSSHAQQPSVIGSDVVGDAQSAVEDHLSKLHQDLATDGATQASLLRASLLPPVSSASPAQTASASSISSARSDALVGVIMGSDSDLRTMKAAAELLRSFSVPFELTIVSAHRTPQRMFEYARSAHSRGLRCIIAGAGGAAHLPGMVAALTPLPVIGVPIPLTYLDGVDSLHSIVQMPRGIPCATVAIGNATNAALLAIRMLGIADPALIAAMESYMQRQADEVHVKVERLAREGWEHYKT